MRRIQIIVAYDGTQYHGWQLQTNGVTIEEVLNDRLSRLLKEPIRVIGASRTDSGVHSMGTPAVFDTHTKIPPEKICYAINQYLPDDIVVIKSFEVPSDFQPRKCNSLKTYEYRILNSAFPMPHLRFTAYHFHRPLDIERMREAAAFLVGEHDYKSFCSAATYVEETVRTIYEAAVMKHDDVITIRLTANGFLMHMVRIIAGTLIQVGIGHYSPGEVKQILVSRDRLLAGTKAPAHGLTMMGFHFQDKLSSMVIRNNEEWTYLVLQQHLETKGVVYLCILHCQECDFFRTVTRLVIHAIQNGASEVFICDTKGRLNDHCCINRFVFEPLSDVSLPQIKEEQLIDPLSERFITNRELKAQLNKVSWFKTKG